MATNPAGESTTEDATRLRDQLTDLASLLSQPALWRDGMPPQTISGALDELVARTSELIAANDRLTRQLAAQRQQ
jgi:hypothetical protein